LKFKVSSHEDFKIEKEHLAANNKSKETEIYPEFKESKFEANRIQNM